MAAPAAPAAPLCLLGQWAARPSQHFCSSAEATPLLLGCWQACWLLCFLPPPYGGLCKNKTFTRSRSCKSRLTRGEFAINAWKGAWRSEERPNTSSCTFTMLILAAALRSDHLSMMRSKHLEHWEKTGPSSCPFSALGLFHPTYSQEQNWTVHPPFIRRCCSSSIPWHSQWDVMQGGRQQLTEAPGKGSMMAAPGCCVLTSISYPAEPFQAQILSGLVGHDISCIPTCSKAACWSPCCSGGPIFSYHVQPLMFAGNLKGCWEKAGGCLWPTGPASKYISVMPMQCWIWKQQKRTRWVLFYSVGINHGHLRRPEKLLRKVTLKSYLLVFSMSCSIAKARSPIPLKQLLWDL